MFIKKITILNFIILIGLTGIACGGGSSFLKNSASQVEKKYGSKMVDDLKKLYQPPTTNKNGLVTPRSRNSDWSDTYSSQIYRQWIANNLGSNNYQILNKKIREKTELEKRNPSLIPIREMLRQAFSGQNPSIQKPETNFFGEKK